MSVLCLQLVVLPPRGQKPFNAGLRKTNQLPSLLLCRLVIFKLSKGQFTQITRNTSLSRESLPPYSEGQWGEVDNTGLFYYYYYWNKVCGLSGITEGTWANKTKATVSAGLETSRVKWKKLSPKEKQVSCIIHCLFLFNLSHHVLGKRQGNTLHTWPVADMLYLSFLLIFQSVTPVTIAFYGIIHLFNCCG